MVSDTSCDFTDLHCTFASQSKTIYIYFAQNRGINVVKYDTETEKHSLLLSRKTKDGVGLATKQGEDFEYNSTEVAEDLLLNLDIKAAEAESYSLTQIKPGLVIEDRFTQPLTQPGDNDVMPAFEFNVFTVWGKVLFANCKTG